MKYERVTKRTEQGKTYTDECFGCMDGVDCLNCPINESVWERLAELEDKIEQGTLIEAPKHKYVVAESNITGKKFACKLFPQALYSKVENAWTFWYDTFAFSTILYKFDTKEEAEKKLKELQE